MSTLKPNHISEIKALAKPSELIRTVLTGIVILIYDGPIIKDFKEGIHE